MALTKKMAKKIADLINECTVARMMVDSPVKSIRPADHSEYVRRWMANHDQASQVLNGILGQEAVVPYHRKAL